MSILEEFHVDRVSGNKQSTSSECLPLINELIDLSKSLINSNTFTAESAFPHNLSVSYQQLR